MLSLVAGVLVPSPPLQGHRICLLPHPWLITDVLGRELSSSPSMLQDSGARKGWSGRVPFLDPPPRPRVEAEPVGALPTSQGPAGQADGEQVGRDPAGGAPFAPRSVPSLLLSSFPCAERALRGRAVTPRACV